MFAYFVLILQERVFRSENVKVLDQAEQTLKAGDSRKLHTVYNSLVKANELLDREGQQVKDDYGYGYRSEKEVVEYLQYKHLEVSKSSITIMLARRYRFWNPSSATSQAAVFTPSR
jgi:hypothetical protein